MEKISMNVAPRLTQAAPAGAYTPIPPTTPTPAPALSRQRLLASPAGRPGAFVDKPAAVAFDDMLNGIDFSGSSTSATGSDSLFGDPSGTALQDALSSPDDYQAFLEAGGHDKAHGTLNVAPLFASTVNARQPVTDASETLDNDKLTQIEPEEACVESFTIAHPNWGVLDVDSRRQGASWEVVVRCADSDTRQKLKRHEIEFRALLKREFGVSLELDVQPASRT